MLPCKSCQHRRRYLTSVMTRKHGKCRHTVKDRRDMPRSNGTVPNKPNPCLRDIQCLRQAVGSAANICNVRKDDRNPSPALFKISPNVKNPSLFPPCLGAHHKTRNQRGTIGTCNDCSIQAFCLCTFRPRLTLAEQQSAGICLGLWPSLFSLRTKPVWSTKKHNNIQQQSKRTNHPFQRT